jgi:hypothetical protein
MSETTTPPSAPPEKGLFARFVGVLFTPKETFLDVVARPKWFGMLAITTVLAAVLIAGFFATDVGQRAYIDKAAQGSPFGGPPPSGDALKAIERFASYMPYVYGIGILIMSPIITLIIAGIAFAIFGAAMGGQGTFKQVFSVVTHAGVISVVGQLIITPVNYVRETLDSPMNLAVLMPFLDPGSFVAKLAGSIDLFRIWWVMGLSIGLAVLYKKKTQSVAIPLFVVYAIIAIVVAAIAASRSTT